MGVQGRLSIESKDKELIMQLSEYAQKERLSHSLKKEFTTAVTLQNDKMKLLKSAKFIVLEKEYLKTKFKMDNISPNTLFVNHIFLKSMGGMDINSFEKIAFDQNKQENLYDIGGFKVVQSGFLSSKPIIFITSEFASKLFGNIKTLTSKIEFLELNQRIIDKIKTQVTIEAKKLKTSELKIHDLLQDTKETREFFEKISIVQNAISSLIFILSMGIIILSISIAVEFKKSSLKTLQLVGMSSNDLANTISGVILITVISILFISTALQSFFQAVFISLISFGETFFIDTDFETILFIILLGSFLSIASFFITKYMFKRV